MKAVKQKRDRIQGNLIDKTNQYVDELFAKIMAKLSGGVLNRRTGKLASSVAKVPATTYREDMIGGYVTQDLRVAPYGAVHEKGGTKSYDMVPKKGKYMVFQTKGTLVSFVAKGQLKEFYKGRKFVFTKMVHRTPLAKRSFMMASLDEMRGEIVKGIGTVVRD